MTLRAISAAMDRLTTILQRRPDFGLHDDTQATARWEGGLRVLSCHENGTQVLTDMPAELGGGGTQVTPGWLMRAGLASCTATRIAMAAASGQIELSMLEVSANSHSDARGLLGMVNADGVSVAAGPCDMALTVRISAPGVAPDRLRTLVEESYRCSPVSDALCRAVPVSLRIDIDGG
ncbi:MAG: OsmC family protein [Steroidobacteraceae bacterium]